MSQQVEWRLDETGQLTAYIDGTPAVWFPQPGSQEAFMRCPIFETLLAGNRGGGKTDVLLMDFAQHVGKGFGEEWKGILFRRTFPELDDVIGKSLKWFKKIWPKAEYNKQAKTWVFPDGETLKFRHISRPNEYWSYHGHSYPWIGFEELTTWPNSDCYTPLFSLCRSSHIAAAKLCGIRATTNPYGCVPYGEVLTADRGWADIKDIRPGESVVSVDKDGVAIRSSAYPVVQKYDGAMISRNGRGLNMVFTEDHRLPHLNTSGDSFTIKHFHELPGQAILKRTADGWAGTGPATITPGVTVPVRKLKSKQVPSLTAVQYAALLGWMLSEGCPVSRDKAFQIAQSKSHTRPIIERLLEDCGFTYRKDPQAFIITEPNWSKHFEQFGKCRDKFIPQVIKSHNTGVLGALLDALMMGDGCENTYYTASKRLADDVAEIATKLGYAVFVSSRQRPERSGLCYAVHMSENRQTQLNTGNHVYDVATSVKKLNITRESFVGEVYCLTVPDTETFFIRQNGCVWLSGNSGHNWVKKRFHLPMGEGMLIGKVIKDERDVPEDEKEKPRVAIRSSLAENKILLMANPTYVQTLRAAARNPAELAAWIEGSWDITSGGMFDDIWKEGIHVIPDIPYILLRKSGWFLNRAYDHGLSKPFSVGWWAVSNGNPITVFGKQYGEVKGDMFLFDEYYGCQTEDNKGLNMTAQEIAAQIKLHEKEMGMRGRIKRGPADSAIFSKYDGKKTVAGDMKKEGVYWDAVDKSSGSRIQGWQQIRNYLTGALPNPNGPREKAGIFICDRCRDTRRTVPCLPRDDKNLDDVNSEVEDHAGDMIRYRLRWTRRSITQRKW